MRINPKSYSLCLRQRSTILDAVKCFERSEYAHSKQLSKAVNIARCEDNITYAQDLITKFERDLP
jgi:hypothetical protein